jgi:hypothetical protein
LVKRVEEAAAGRRIADGGVEGAANGGRIIRHGLVSKTYM